MTTSLEDRHPRIRELNARAEALRARALAASALRWCAATPANNYRPSDLYEWPEGPFLYELVHQVRLSHLD